MYITSITDLYIALCYMTLYIFVYIYYTIMKVNVSMASLKMAAYIFIEGVSKSRNLFLSVLVFVFELGDTT